MPLAYKNSVIIPSLTKYAKRILLNLQYLIVFFNFMETAENPQPSPYFKTFSQEIVPSDTTLHKGPQLFFLINH